MTKNFTLTTTADNIALISIDSQQDAANALNLQLLPELEEIIHKINEDQTTKGVIFYSKKPNIFIAGADINMIESCKSVEEATNIAATGQAIFEKIANINKITLAAINGACLGGGLEFALACDYRICTLQPKTILGLPEVKLGLIPGSGGTKRLPQTIGLINSLEYMLTGKNIRPNKAKKIGLVDEVVNKYDYINSAIKLLEQKKFKRNKNIYKRIRNQIESNVIVKNIIQKQTLKTIARKTKDNYPAPYKILKSALMFNKANHCKIESMLFGELVFTNESKALRSLFLETNKIKQKHLTKYDNNQKIDSINIFGAGLMGTGIATATILNTNYKVFINEKNQNAINNSINFINKQIYNKYQAKHINKIDLYKKKIIYSC